MSNERTSKIEYLLRSKFGTLAPAPIERLGRGDSEATKAVQERNKDFALYRAKLSKLSDVELSDECKRERLLRVEENRRLAVISDSERRFSQSYANLDVEHWAKISFWTPDEGVAISLDKDPRHVSWENVKQYAKVSPFVQEYEARRMLVERAKAMNQLYAKTSPGFFIAWAKRSKFPIPDSIVSAVKANGVLVGDWKAGFDLQVAKSERLEGEVQRLKSDILAIEERHRTSKSNLIIQQDEIIKKLNAALVEKSASLEEAKAKTTAPADAEINPRVKETLLKIIIGMAIDGYGYQPTQLRSPTARELSDHLQRLGLEVSDDTIRNYLKEAAQLLPPQQAE